MLRQLRPLPETWRSLWRSPEVCVARDLEGLGPCPGLGSAFRMAGQGLCRRLGEQQSGDG